MNINQIIPMTARSAIGIQSGEVTHHHEHFATFPISANFKTRNTANITPPNPIPLPAEDDLLLIKLI
jgi:hypothetical protein